MKSSGHMTGWPGVAAALLVAVLFGASTPLAKSVSPRVDPVLMAGLLYVGSGLGLAAYAWLRARRTCFGPAESPLDAQRCTLAVAGAILVAAWWGRHC